MKISKEDEGRIKRLRPMAIPAHLEDAAKQLFEDVCCGSRALWPCNPDRLKEGKFRREFYRLAHNGMWAAQERFLNRLSDDESLVPGEEALYRMAMDSIAWQMIQRQLCYARRLYRDHPQPSLKNSNLESVIKAARYLREQQPDSMPLITDLTTFVQIGDLMISDPNHGMTIAEVKEGKKNHEIGKLAIFYQQSGCERFKQFVSKTETTKTVKQFERMARQIDRMQFATNVLGKGRARDPDTSEEIYIPEPFIPIDEWDEKLNELLERALDKGWAIDVIDNCVFVGAYAKHMMHPAPVAFWVWMREFAGCESTPIARLIDCVTEPLTLPMFMVYTHPERMLDLLFGRLHVCMGVSIPGLIEECTKRGITARPPQGKKERKQANRLGRQAIWYQGQPVVLERNGRVVFPAVGIFARLLFHFQRPMSFINAMFENSEAPPEPQTK